MHVHYNEDKQPDGRKDRRHHGGGGKKTKMPHVWFKQMGFDISCPPFSQPPGYSMKFVELVLGRGMGMNITAHCSYGRFPN